MFDLFFSLVELFLLFKFISYFFFYFYFKINFKEGKQEKEMLSGSS